MNFESEEANLCTSVTAKVIEGKVRNAFFFFFFVEGNQIY